MTLTDDLYDAVFDDGAFVRVLQEIVALNGGGSAFLLYLAKDLSKARVVSCWGPFSAISSAYEKTYFRDDPLLLSYIDPGLNDLHSSDALLGRDAYRNHPFVADVLSRAAAPYERTEFFRFADTAHSVGIFAVCFSGRNEAHNIERTLPVMRELVPHFKRVMALRRSRIETSSKSLELAMQTIGNPVAICSGSGGMIECNDAAASILGGSVVSCSAGSKGTNRVASDIGRDLLKFIEQMEKQKRTRGQVMLHDSEDRPVLADFASLELAQGAFTRVQCEFENLADVSMVVSLKRGDTGACEISEEAVREFQITAVERTLLQELINGKSLQSIAKENNKSYYTVRNQLASVMEKTGLRRQKDLVRYFASLA